MVGFPFTIVFVCARRGWGSERWEHTYFVYELAFFGMLDVVVVVSLFHLNEAHLHSVTSIHEDYVVVYELFFVPVHVCVK